MGCSGYGPVMPAPLVPVEAQMDPDTAHRFCCDAHRRRCVSLVSFAEPVHVGADGTVRRMSAPVERHDAEAGMHRGGGDDGVVHPSRR